MRLATALTITVEAPEFHAAAAGAIPEPDHEQITAERSPGFSGTGARSRSA
jgi:hypothetical protein